MLKRKISSSMCLLIHISSALLEPLGLVSLFHTFSTTYNLPKGTSFQIYVLIYISPKRNTMSSTKNPLPNSTCPQPHLLYHISSTQLQFQMSSSTCPQPDVLYHMSSTQRVTVLSHMFSNTCVLPHFLYPFQIPNVLFHMSSSTCPLPHVLYPKGHCPQTHVLYHISSTQFQFQFSSSTCPLP